ncbi:MAG: hypothetical protein ACOCYN_03690 [Planctomycetota bacterium]
MSLRYIVPSLGILACSAGAVQAAEIGSGVTLDGYVDTILEITSADENALGFSTNAGGTTPPPGEPEASDTVADFSAGAQLEFGYSIGDVSAKLELYYTADRDVDGLDVEQAWAQWDFKPDQAYFKMGHMEVGLGFEATDAPGLYRINTSQLRQMLQPQQTTGGSVGFKANDNFSGAVTLCDGLAQPLPDAWGLDEMDPPSIGEAAKDNADIALILQGMYKMEDIGEFEAALVYDMGAMGATVDGALEQDDALAIDVNGLITAMEESNLAFGFDLSYWSLGEVTAYGAMAMANYTFATDTPMAGTLMLDYVSVDAGDANPGDDDMFNVFEVAAALLTQPTNEENVALNFELRYLMRDADAEVEDVDEIGVFVELLAIIP